MIRPGIRPIVVAAMASGIAQKGMEEPDLTPLEMAMFRRIREAAELLVAGWPARIRSQREIAAIERHIGRFTELTKWDARPRNIQTYVHFLSYLLEDIRQKLTDPKRLALVDDILDATTDLWRHYSSGRDREYEWCLQAGIRAAMRWEGIIADDTI